MKEKLKPWAGSIALALVASALWEYIRPIFSWIYQAVLIAGTSYFDSLVRSSYVQIGLGDENAFLEFIALNIVILLLLSAAFLVAHMDIARRSGGNYWNYFMKTAHPILYLVVLFMALNLLTGAARTYYVSASTRTLRGMLLSVTPYVETSVLNSLRSRSALMRSRADFVSLTDDINAHLKRAGIPPYKLIIL